MARTVRGIEALVAREIRRSRLGVVRRVRHREVWFEPAPGAGLPDLRMADDVLLAAAVVDGIGRDRPALRRLAAAARALDASGVARLACRTGPATPDGGSEVPPAGSRPRVPPAGGNLQVPPVEGGSQVPPARGGLEVSASFVGRRNYTRFEVEDAVGAELARPLRLAYHSRRDGLRPPPGAMSWRVTIEDDQAVIALRPAGRPLHRRPYKLASVRGTLHPPVAAAMAELARLGGAGTVLDPCCGAGTTLIEAHALIEAHVPVEPHVPARSCAPAPNGPRLLGFDHDPVALEAAAANSGAIGTGIDVTAGAAIDAAADVTAGAAIDATAGATAASPSRAARRSPFRWAVADAGRIPVAAGGADRVLVNPPWGRQVAPRGTLARDGGLLWREVRRVLAADGVAVALLHDEVPSGFAVEEAVRISLSGLHPLIAVLRTRAA